MHVHVTIVSLSQYLQTENNIRTIEFRHAVWFEAERSKQPMFEIRKYTAELRW